MRDDYDNRPNYSATTLFIGILVAVYILQTILSSWFGSGAMLNYGALTTESLKSGYIWTVFSYALLHGGIYHLLGNCLGLLFIGRALETALGPRRIWQLTALSTLTGALVWSALNFRHDAAVIGASGVAFAYMTVFSLLYPERTITLLLFFVLPLNVKPKWVLRVMLAIAVFGVIFFEIPGGSDGIAHSAHLGGILGGWMFYRFFLNRQTSAPSWMSFGREDSVSIEQPGWLKKFKKSSADTPNYKVNTNTTSPEDLKSEIDRILDKIYQSGIDSLTPQERALLDEQHSRLSRR